MIKIINTPSLYGSLYEAIELSRGIKGKIDIIVPDKLALFMEKFLFEQLNISASFDLRVSTLNRFAKKKCLVSKESQISEVGGILLIHKILNENAACLKSLKSKAYSFSYAENILKTINQFKASKITWEEMENFSSSNIQLKNKILDIAFVNKEYENLKAGMLDSADMFLMSTLYVAEGVENENFLFIGFDDFTAIEYSIIEMLAEKNNVTVLVNFGCGNNKSIFNKEIYSQLKNIAFIKHINLIVEDANITYSKEKEFLHSNLFALKSEKVILEKETIKVVAANSFEEEIEFVARDIRNRIINGDKYSNYGVAIFDLESKLNIVKEKFAKYNINYYLDTQLHLNKSIFYKFLCSVVKYNLESYTSIKWLKL